MSGVTEIENALAERLEAPSAAVGLSRACIFLLEKTNQVKPPIRLRPLLQYLDVDIVYHDGEETRGKEVASLLLRKGRLSVAIERKALHGNVGRARFSIAHELAHALIIRTLGARALELAEADEHGFRRTEQLCDLAASHLLMPLTMLIPALRKRRFTRHGVHSIRKAFDVSEYALLRAIAGSVARGGIVELKYHRRNDGEAETWRVLRTFATPDSAGTRLWLPSGCTLKHIRSAKPLDNLQADTVVDVGHVSLIMRKQRAHYRGVASLWSRGAVQSQFVDKWDECPKARQPGIGDADRLLLLLGEGVGFDSALFTGEQSDESLHIGGASSVPGPGIGEGAVCRRR